MFWWRVEKIVSWQTFFLLFQVVHRMTDEISRIIKKNTLLTAVTLKKHFSLNPNVWSWMCGGGGGVCVYMCVCLCFKGMLALQMFKKIFKFFLHFFFYPIVASNHWLQLHFQVLPLFSFIYFFLLFLFLRFPATGWIKILHSLLAEMYMQSEGTRREKTSFIRPMVKFSITWSDF